jgi:hypothetical protein
MPLTEKPSQQTIEEDLNDSALEQALCQASEQRNDESTEVVARFNSAI